MKLLSLIVLAALPVSALASVRPTTRETPPVESLTDSSRALDRATAEGATTSKSGGSTRLQDASGGTGTETSTAASTAANPQTRTETSARVKPTVDGVPPGEEARTASEELRTGTTSTGGTGTRLDDAGSGSTSNTTGTGSMGSDSGR